MKHCILIPAYNEEKNLPVLIHRLKKSLVSANIAESCQIVVINDGSTDNTAQDLDGVTVINHRANKGKGAALRTGIEYARKNGFTSIVTMDADLQHEPDDLIPFLGTNSSVTLGQREFGGQMPVIRRLANHGSSLLCSILLRTRISDVHCGMRKFSVSMFRDIRIKRNRFDGELEALLKAVRKASANGGKTFVKVKTIYHGNKTSIRPLEDTARFFWTVMFNGL